MKEETLTVIPPEDQAYEWARKEMERFFPKPDRFRIQNLDRISNRLSASRALFRKGKDDPVILRVYWPDTDSVKYSIVANYDELCEEHPELVEQLLLNGRYAYEDMVKRAPQYVNELLYGKGSKYLS